MMSLFHSIRDFIHFTRMYQWHPGKMPLMLGFVLTILLVTPDSQQGLLWVLAAYILTCLYLTSAYMLNNIADKKQDNIANKRVGLEGWSHGRLVISVIIFMVFGLGIGFVLLPVLAIYAMIGCYILAWAYSFPPRFKEHFILGPFVSSFAHIPAPALVMTVAWGTLPLPAFSYLAVVFFYGLRMILVHQLLDYENDRITGTHTTAIVLGVFATRRFLQFIFVLEMLCTIIFLVLIVYAGFPKILLISLAWPLLLVILRWTRREPIQLDSYSYIPLADVHESLIPLILAIGVAMREGGIMIAIIPFIILLFLDRYIERLVWPLFHWKETTND